MKSDDKVAKAVKTAIPKGQRFTLIWEPLAFDKARILRVLTSAWKTLPRYRRIMKVQKALNQSLSDKELDRIFRVSVMTTQEFRRLQQMLPASLTIPRRNGRSRRNALTNSR